MRSIARRVPSCDGSSLTVRGWEDKMKKRPRRRASTMIHIRACGVHNWTCTYMCVCVRARRDTAHRRSRSFRLSNRPVRPCLVSRSFAFKSPPPSWKRIQYAPGKRNMFDDDGERAFVARNARTTTMHHRCAPAVCRPVLIEFSFSHDFPDRASVRFVFPGRTCRTVDRRAQEPPIRLRFLAISAVKSKKTFGPVRSPQVRLTATFEIVYISI